MTVAVSPSLTNSPSASTSTRSHLSHHLHVVVDSTTA